MGGFTLDQTTMNTFSISVASVLFTVVICWFYLESISIDKLTDLFFTKISLFYPTEMKLIKVVKEEK